MKTLFKSLPANMTIFGHKFEVGKWYKEENIKICERGFHASKRAIDAMGYVDCEVLALVEVKGKSEKETDKECWSEMRLVKTYNWTKEDSVALSIYSAELVIDLFEKEFSDDKRPREAIEAAKKWLEDPTEENRSAAESARSAAESAWSAAWSAWYAAESARSAAWSAWYAAESARSAAWSAAESARSAARSAAWSAWYAAESADYEKTLNKIEKWIQKRVNLK